MKHPLEKIMAYLSQEELEQTGFKQTGQNVLISTKCSIYGAENISIGDNVRIDDFCIISAAGINGKLRLGSHLHVAAFASLFAGAGIIIDNFCTISSRTTIYSSSDDYSGEFLLSGPIFPEKYINVDCRGVRMEKYSSIGAHSLVLPGVRLGEGAVLGAMSLAKNDLDPWHIHAGIPAKKIKKRKMSMIPVARNYLNSDGLL